MRTTSLAGVALACAALAGAHAAEPRLVLESDRWDFGTVTQGRTLTREIAVWNRGDAPLVVSAVRVSCGACTAASVSKRVAPPGGRLSLRLTFYTARAAGRQNKTVTIGSNDPANPFQTIRITGVVVKRPRPRLALEPDTLDLGLLREGETRQALVRVRNAGDATLKVTAVRAAAGWRVTRRPTEAIAPGKSAQIVLEWTPTQPGLMQGYVQVESNDPSTPNFVVPIVGYVAASAQARRAASGVTIQAARLGPLAPGHGRLVERYRVTNRTDAAVTVEQAEGGKGVSLSPRRLSLGPGETGEFAVRLGPEFSFERGGGNVALTVRLPLTQAGGGPKPRAGRADPANTRGGAR